MTDTIDEAIDETLVFWEEYFNQENYGTAYPIYFVIRDVDWQACYHFDDGDRYVCIYDTDEIARADSLKQLFEILKKDENDLKLKFPEDLDLDWVSEFDADQFCKLNQYINGIFAEKREYKEHNMFLLKSEAEQHLKQNHYHYSSEAHVYCKHAWRAKRQENALNALRTLKSTHVIIPKKDLPEELWREVSLYKQREPSDLLPDEITADTDGTWIERCDDSETSYTRTDIHQALLAENAAMREALQNAAGALSTCYTSTDPITEEKEQGYDEPKVAEALTKINQALGGGE